MFLVFEKLAEQSLKMLGWEIDNHWPLDLEQCVMIAAPHTSNWDALYARLALKALGVNVRLTIKDSYMKLPFGPFVRAMGGIGINREPKKPGEPYLSMVQVMTDLFKTHPKLVMIVTPEATRAKQEKEERTAAFSLVSRRFSCFRQKKERTMQALLRRMRTAIPCLGFKKA